MNIEFKREPVDGLVKPATVVFLTPGEEALESREEISSIKPFLRDHLFSGAFKGEYLDSLPLYLNGGWLVAVGLGQGARLTEERYIEAAAQAGQKLKELKVNQAVVILPPTAKFGQEKTAELTALGLKLAITPRNDYKSSSKDREGVSLKTITLQMTQSYDSNLSVKAALDRATAMAKAQQLTRELTERPANLLTPKVMANICEDFGQKHSFSVTIWDEHKLASEKCGCLLAVGQASHNPPRMVIMEYIGKSGGSLGAPRAIIGKGVTFDSGGLFLKPADNIAHMKGDMSGAAAVLSLMVGVTELNLPIHLVAILALAENMPGGAAVKPGDIVVSLSGQTVEITNTDAEGRLLLADALSLAQRYDPYCLIDVATLTGACAVALGENCAGVFSNHDYLRNDVIKAGREVGEDFWPLPLYEPYAELLKSDLADLKNWAARSGGAIHAALFLKKFVKDELPWVHIDIAGTARKGKSSPSCPEGPTGFGARTLLKLLSNSASGQ
ncbi:MAG: leucyl aminopeptidase [Deltaproteobacteria bacterium]|jgi:leucyl aminopeptidase|nr:leucyl aminopeptidase [Deltaproteobacteria bacterium]